MSKWRTILVGTVASGALATGAFLPAHAERIDVPGAGSITVAGDPMTQTGHVTADGTIAGTPGDGYITAGNDGVDGPTGVCADDNGSNANPQDDPATPGVDNPGGSTSPTCTPDVTG